MTPNLTPVEWPLAARLRFFGGWGLALAVLAVAGNLPFADVPNNRMFVGRYGWVPIWPWFAIEACALIGGGVLVGMLLPLYRRAYGWVWIGLAVWLLLVALLILTGALPGESGGSIEPWQRIVVLLIMGCIAPVLASLGTDRATGRRKPAPGAVPEET